MTAVVIGLLLIALVAAGYPWHRAVVRARAAEEDASKWRSEWARAVVSLSQANETAESLTATAAGWRESHKRARADADWNEMQRVIVQAELDRHEATHCCLPTLDGIRAESAEREAMPGQAFIDNGMAALEAKHGASVTPLRKKGRA